MVSRNVSISTGEGAFDCYLTMAQDTASMPGIVIAPSAFGVDESLRALCDFLADKGLIVAAPDVFWRTDKGPLLRNDQGQERARVRTADRSTAMAGARRDVAATLAYLRRHPACNGKTAILGFCFGGPLAVVGITELDCDCGAAFHGSDFEGQIEAIEQVRKPLQLHWGDEDFACPRELLERVVRAADRNANCTVFIYPGVKHGYTARSSAAYEKAASDLSWERTLPMLLAKRAPARG